MLGLVRVAVAEAIKRFSEYLTNEHDGALSPRDLFSHALMRAARQTVPRTFKPTEMEEVILHCSVVGDTAISPRSTLSLRFN